MGFLLVNTVRYCGRAVLNQRIYALTKAKTRYIFCALAWCVICLPVSAVGAPTISLSMEGAITQGALIRARTDVGAKASLNDVPLSVNSQGEFVFALWRDTPATVRLKLTRMGAVSTLQRIEIIHVQQREWDIQRIDNVPSNKVTPPARDYARITNEGTSFSTAMEGVIEDSSFKKVFGEGFIQPTDGVVSGIFGSQRFFNGKARRPHYGLDIANKEGTAIIAPADGTVRFTHPDMFFNGKTLVLYHGQGVFSSFVHLHEILVEEGQQVKRGDIIAAIGATGRVTGPHLHWSVKYKGIPVDPALLLEANSAVCAYAYVHCETHDVR